MAHAAQRSQQGQPSQQQQFAQRAQSPASRQPLAPVQASRQQTSAPQQQPTQQQQYEKWLAQQKETYEQVTKGKAGRSLEEVVSHDPASVARSLKRMGINLPEQEQSSDA